VLVPNSLSEKQTKTVLKDYNDADKTEYDEYTKYQQVDLSAVKEDTHQLIYLDKDTRVLALVGELIDAKQVKDPKEVGAEKEAVDYATIDSMLTEAYAMMDIMMGSLQQSGMTAESRKEIILSALKNFETFVTTFFSEASDKEATKSIEGKLLAVLLQSLSEIEITVD